MNGEKQFSVRDVIKTAWHNVHGAKWPIWAPQLVMLVIYLGVALIFAFIGAKMGLLPRSTIGMGIGFIIAISIFEIIVVFLVSPLVAGMQMNALKKVRGETVNASMAFKYWHKWIPLGFTVLFFAIGNAIISQVFTALIKISMKIPFLAILFALILLIATLLYVVFFMFNILFVADKNKGPFAALIDSAKTVAPHWLRVFLLVLYVILVVIIVGLPATLGLLCPIMAIKILGVLVSIALFIWALPYWNLIIATIYHRLTENQIRIPHV